MERFQVYMSEMGNDFANRIGGYLILDLFNDKIEPTFVRSIAEPDLFIRFFDRTSAQIYADNLNGV